jgi:hypothetical protein
MTRTTSIVIPLTDRELTAIRDAAKASSPRISTETWARCVLLDAAGQQQREDSA